MKEMNALEVLNCATHLEKLETLFMEWETPMPEGFSVESEIHSSLRHNIADTYKGIAIAADVIDAPVTGLAAQRARKRLLARKTPITYKELRGINAEVKSRFEDELGSVKFYCLSKGADTFYGPVDPLFGKEVEVRIPKASNDISEAGKCFAVGRYTASVFHLMRAMEVAVQAVASALSIENVEREWGKLLSDISGKIQPMPKGGERDEWSQAHANLYHVKQAWRNDTMHPKATYTEEEAREVFDAMKAFMRHLASMLPKTVDELVG